MQPLESVPIPAAYRPEFAEEARKLALMRTTDEALARHFEIPLATLREWLAAVPAFARAVRQGRSLGDADVVDRVHQNAVGFAHEVVRRPAGAEEEPVRVLRRRPPNKQARHFWMVNRLPGAWCHKGPVEADLDRGVPRRLTRAALDRFIAECATAREAGPGE